MIDELLAQLRRDDGVRYTPYYDPVGIATLGAGHRLDLPICEAAVDQILRDDVAHALADCAALACWPALSARRQGVLVNMCFNFGFKGLTGFRRLLAALEVGDLRAGGGRDAREPMGVAGGRPRHAGGPADARGSLGVIARATCHPLR